MADEADNQELTQADGDAATAGAGPSPSPAGQEGAAEEASAGALTQADIDAALGGAEQPSEAQAGIDAAAADSAGAEPSADGVQEPAADAASGSQADTPVDSAGGPSDESAAVEKVTLPDFSGAAAQEGGEAEDVAGEIGILNDVNLNVRIELGRSHMRVEDVLRLGAGSVVELDKLAGDPVDVYVNGYLVARGEVLVLNDNFCVRVSEIIGEFDGDKVAEARAG